MRRSDSGVPKPFSHPLDELFRKHRSLWDTLCQSNDAVTVSGVAQVLLVSPIKPLGYVTESELLNAGTTLEEVSEILKITSPDVTTFRLDSCTKEHSTYYGDVLVAYHNNALSQHLKKYNALLISEGWPTEPRDFARKVMTIPSISLRGMISEAFGDFRPEYKTPNSVMLKELFKNWLKPEDTHLQEDNSWFSHVEGVRIRFARNLAPHDPRFLVAMSALDFLGFSVSLQQSVDQYGQQRGVAITGREGRSGDISQGVSMRRLQTLVDLFNGWIDKSTESVVAVVVEEHRGEKDEKQLLVEAFPPSSKHVSNIKKFGELRFGWKRHDAERQDCQRTIVEFGKWLMQTQVLPAARQAEGLHPQGL